MSGYDPVDAEMRAFFSQCELLASLVRASPDQIAILAWKCHRTSISDGALALLDHLISNGQLGPLWADLGIISGDIQ